VFGVSAPEALLTSLVALLDFGSRRLSEAAQEWESLLGNVRRGLDETVAKLTSEDYPDEWFEDHGQQQESLFDGRPEG
jgi:Sec-independent protein translocase protein TatA